MAQGIGGMMGLTGTADGEPMRVGVADLGYFFRRLCGGRHPRRAGAAGTDRQGGYVDAALVNSTVGVLSFQALNYLVSGEVPKRIGNTHPNLVPYQVFPVADGRIIIATGNDAQFVKLCGMLGAPQLADVPEYKDNKGRLAHRAELVGKLSCADLAPQARRTAAEAGNRRHSRRTDQRSRTGFADPQVIHRGMRLELKSDAAKGGSIPGLRTPIVLDGAPMASDRPAPRLGEHTAEILREIGEGERRSSLAIAGRRDRTESCGGRGVWLRRLVVVARK